MSDGTNDMIQILTTVIDHLEDAQDTGSLPLEEEVSDYIERNLYEPQT
jgi:hypothetical protein